MALVSVAEAAGRLGVRAQRVHQRIGDGSLAAHRIGSQWVIDEIDLLPLRDAAHSPGRPLSERSALALLLVAEPDPLRRREVMDASLTGQPHGGPCLTPGDRARARRRLVDLVRPGSGPEESALRERTTALRRALARRATRHPYRVSPRDLDDLRADRRLHASGISAPESGLASGDVVEAYVERGLLDHVVERCLLDPAPAARADVVLHASSAVPLAILAQRSDAGGDAHHVCGPRALLLAADLAEHRDPRSEARAVDLLARVRELLGPTGRYG